MSNKKKRKRPAGARSGYRAPLEAAPPRRGLFDGLFRGAPSGGTPMPRLRTTLARGAATAFGIPWLVAAVPLVLLVVWSLLLLIGYQGPFSYLNALFSIPPLSTITDIQIASQAFRASPGVSGAGAALPGLLGFALTLLFHAVLNALVATASVEKLRTGSVSAWAVRRAARVIPVSASIGVAALGLLIAGQLAGQLLAGFFSAIGLVVGVFGSLVVGVYLFGFAPAIAADEERRLTDAVVRSIRAARMPGSANLWLAVGYSAILAVSLFLPVLARLPGAEIAVAPPPAAWAIAILVNLLSVMVQSTFAYRYLAVAPEVPEGPPARRAAARR